MLNAKGVDHYGGATWIEKEKHRFKEGIRLRSLHVYVRNEITTTVHRQFVRGVDRTSHTQ